MVTTHDFYGLETSFSKIRDTIHQQAKSGAGVKISIDYPTPLRNIEYYQHGLKRMTITVDSSKGEEMNKFVERLSNIFTPEEENRLATYTPWLRNFIKTEHFENKILSDCMVIFREHSLISVYNIHQLFKELGLKPEN